jgi:Flp pilus assembly pilin Flp
VYPQRHTSSVAVQSFAGQRWVDLAFVLALIAIVVVVVLSLLGPALGNTVTSASNDLSSPAPALTNTHSEQSVISPSLLNADQTGVEVVSSAPH